MTSADSPLSWDGEDLVLRLRVQPKASHDEIVGVQGGLLKVRITAAPVDGKANQHLTALLARAFGVAKSRVALETGVNSREKRFRIVKPARVPAQLLNIV